MQSWCRWALLGDLFRRLAGPDPDGDHVPAGRFAEDLARCGWLAATGAAPSRRVAGTSTPPTVTARCSAVAHARPLHAARDGTYQAATLLHCRLNLGTLPRVSPCRRNGSCRKEPANAPFAPRRSGPRRYGAPSAGAGSEPPTARSGT